MRKQGGLLIAVVVVAALALGYALYSGIEGQPVIPDPFIRTFRLTESADGYIIEGTITSFGNTELSMKVFNGGQEWQLQLGEGDQFRGVFPLVKGSYVTLALVDENGKKFDSLEMQVGRPVSTTEKK